MMGTPGFTALMGASLRSFTHPTELMWVVLTYLSCLSCRMGEGAQRRTHHEHTIHFTRPAYCYLRPAQKRKPAGKIQQAGKGTGHIGKCRSAQDTAHGRLIAGLDIVALLQNGQRLAEACIDFHR